MLTANAELPCRVHVCLCIESKPDFQLKASWLVHHGNRASVLLKARIHVSRDSQCKLQPGFRTDNQTCALHVRMATFNCAFLTSVFGCAFDTQVASDVSRMQPQLTSYDLMCAALSYGLNSACVLSNSYSSAAT